MHTGEVIKYMRQKEDLTQQELADMLGVQKSSVQKYENGSVQNLKLETMQKLCKKFKTSPYAFVFPETWEKVRIDEKNFEKNIILAYINLTDEGKMKLFEYLMDLAEIDKYRRQDPVPITAHWLFSDTEDE